MITFLILSFGFEIWMVWW